MYKFSLSAIITFLLLVSLNNQQVNAQELEVGFVNFYEVLGSMPQMAAVQQEVQNYTQEKIQELQQKERELQTTFQEFQQQSEVLSESARQEREERLEEMNLEFQQLQAQAEREVQQRRMELLEPLFNQVQSIIDEVARENDLDYVLKTTTDTGDQVILWVSPEIRQEYDLTDGVMQRVD